MLVYQCITEGNISNSLSYFNKVRRKISSLNSTTPFLVTMNNNHLPKVKWILLNNPRDKFFCKFVLLLKPSCKYRKLCSYFFTMVWLLGDKQPVSTSIYKAAKTYFWNLKCYIKLTWWHLLCSSELNFSYCVNHFFSNIIKKWGSGLD